MLKDLKRNLKFEKKNNNIFDIVVYGSSVKGKLSPRDTDIIVLFLEGTLRQRIEVIQKITKFTFFIIFR